MFNDGFYPTPKSLIHKMIKKIKGSPGRILEPSAGRGDIIEALKEEQRYGKIYAIENDPELQAMLRGKKIDLLDSDFLGYAGMDKFDLILGNPPYAECDKHLLKAIDILYRGQIIFLLNAETLRNPCTNTRKTLISRLSSLGAEIEYLPNEFRNAERPTGVEVALVNIIIDRKVEDDLFADCSDSIHVKVPVVSEECKDVSTRKGIEELVAEYNEVIRIGTETIISYYRNYRKIGGYIAISCNCSDKIYDAASDLTGKMQVKLNDLLENARKSFWRKSLNLEAIKSRLTAKRQAEFEEQLECNSKMDFTEYNLRQFVLNFIGGYSRTMTDAVMEIFDMFTARYAFTDGMFDSNIHYFNGWKSNNAFKINKKVVIPVHGGYGRGPFTEQWSGKWKLNWGVEDKLRDIDVVMASLDGKREYVTISQALHKAFERGQSTKIESTYFMLTAYKKGTLHLTFKDEDILRRFNVAACMGKGFLPQDYGRKAYTECPPDEKETIESFEGREAYDTHLGQPVFACQVNPVGLLDFAA